MKTRMLLACLLVLPFFAAGADIVDWIAVSDRRDNALIADLLRGSDFSDQIVIVRALGRRKDFYMYEIIDYLAGTREQHAPANPDHLLRVLLSSVFPEPDIISEEELRDRVRTNRESFENLALNLGAVSDLQLRGEIVRLIPYSGLPGCHGILLAEADKILVLLADGRVTAGQEDYILTYLLAVEKIADSDFLEACLRIYERSAQTEVSRAAARVVSSLKGRDETAAD